jgi:hypothetical protein
MKARRSRPTAILSLLSLLSCLAGCRRADPPDLTAGAPTRQARIFLMQRERGGAAGAGCGGIARPVAVELPAAAPALRGSLEALVAAGHRYDGTGLHNSLADSPLRLERIERAGPTARIYLTGYLEVGGECDGPNALAQLTATAVQFRDVGAAEIFLDGQPLLGLLSKKNEEGGGP